VAIPLLEIRQVGSGDSRYAGYLRLKSTVAQEGTRLPGKIDLEILSILTRVIHQGAAVEVAYRALSSGLTTREIVPFALADSGLRWHVRAFDRRSVEFRDFVLGRLGVARIVPGAVADHEKPDQNIQWNPITELELVPHPANVQHPDPIEAEYGMEGGVLKVRARAAMAGYLLRRWNADCTEIQQRLLATAANDVQDLLPQLQQRGEQLAQEAQCDLQQRGEREAKAMRAILEDQTKAAGGYGGQVSGGFAIDAGFQRGRAAAAGGEPAPLEQATGGPERGVGTRAGVDSRGVRRAGDPAGTGGIGVSLANHRLKEGSDDAQADYSIWLAD
jgi:hypothetical protein